MKRTRPVDRFVIALGVVSGFLILGAGLSSVLGVGQRVTINHEASSGGSLAEDESPVPNGVLTTVQMAKTDMQYPLSFPNTPDANAQTLDAVWENKDLQQVALEYGSGKTITISMLPALYPDPHAELQDQVDLGISQASLTKVNGAPTLVVQPDTDYYKTNPAWVRIISNGVDINIYSTSYGVDTLLDVANSLAPTSAASPN